MRQVIWKYRLKDISCFIEMPIGARVLSVQIQDGHATIWALVDPGNALEERRINVIATGEKFDAQDQVFVGTFQIDRLVFHVFESKT